MAASPSRAITTPWSLRTAGTPASGAINNWRPASMHSDSQARTMREQGKRAVGLLRRAAHPDRRHLGWAVAWLVLAAGLEVIGPILGKALIDQHLLPHRLDWPRMAALLGGMLVSGWIASGLRYLQLVRLSGLAMRS